MTDYIEYPGGWCVPKDQALGPFAEPEQPLRVARGGITYPTPKERLTMTENTTPDINLDDLDTLVRMREQLDTLIREKQDAVKKRRIPSVPPRGAGNKFTIRVKFSQNGKSYEYLILRAPEAKGWYTTGQGEDGHFETWTALVRWLRRPEVYWHSHLQRLVVSNETYLNGDHPNV